MKKQLIILAAVILGLTFSSCVISINGETVKGDGNVVTRDYDVARFDEIVCALPATVNYTVADSYSCTVRVDGNLLEYIDIKVKDGELNAGDIDEQTINDHLWTNFMPDPELLIRTGGELRISNYLLWQCAYSEFYFCDTYWPDFDEACLHKAIADYQSRQRRFGKTEAQVEREERGTRKEEEA
jgi:hypothetical protein